MFSVWRQTENDFHLGDTLIILCDIASAQDQIAPARVARRDAGSRLQMTIFVDDANAICADLARRGAKLINGPIDRPHGKRTACFADPGGHIWEVAQDLSWSERAPDGSDPSAWERTEKRIGHVTLFVDDLQPAKVFYRDVFSLPVTDSDDHSASFRFQNAGVTLLDLHGARELIGPAPVASGEAGSRFQITNFMDPDLCDVDAAAAELAEHGVGLLSGPADRQWGKRTVVFQDPGGCKWELVRTSFSRSRESRIRPRRDDRGVVGQSPQDR